MIRLPLADLAEGPRELPADAARYVARVHRLREGDRLVCFDGRRAVEADARVEVVAPEGVRLAIGSPRPASVRATRPVTLLQGIGKGDKLDAIVRDATELGVTRVVVVETERSVVRLGDRAEARLARWRRIAEEAARQCGRGDVPYVAGPVTWGDAIAGEFGADPLRLCLWERAVDPVARHLATLAPGRPVAIAVGPEGGLAESEVEAAATCGFASVSLGPFVLRTETVAAAMLGALAVASQATEAR